LTWHSLARGTHSLAFFSINVDKLYCFPNSQVYLQQNKKKAEAEGKSCHAKTMLSLEKPIKLI
jgi:hypothetical protein